MDETLQALTRSVNFFVFFFDITVVPECHSDPSTACQLGDIEEDRCSEFGYGFAWSRGGVISRMAGEVGKLIDIESPENVKIWKRGKLCKKYDQKLFNAEHYL